MSSSQIALIVAGLALLGGAVFFLMGDEPAVDVDRDIPQKTARGASAEEKPSDLAPIGRVNTERFREVAEAAEGDEAPLDETGMTFALVTDQAGRPVGGAEVRLVESGGRGGRGGPFGNTNDEPRRIFRTVTSSRDGYALLSPVPRRRFQVVASYGGRVGAETFDQNAEPEDRPPGVGVIVPLMPVKTVVVDVVGPAGEPVSHVRLTASPELDPENDGDANDPGVRFRQVRPDANATQWTETPNGQATFHITRETPGLYEARSVRVEATLHGLEAVAQKVALPDEGTTPVTLRIPRTVGVAVTLKDRDGRLIEEPTRVTWAISDTGNESPTEAPTVGRRGGRGGRGDWMNKGRFGQRTVTGGRAVLAGFAPNTSVTFTTAQDGRTTEMTDVRLDNSAEAVADLLVGDREVTLTLTIHDPEARPIANLQVQPRIDLDDAPVETGAGNPEDMMIRRMLAERMGGRTETTDSEGRITLRTRARVGGKIGIHIDGSPNGFGGFRMGRNAPDAPLVSTTFPGTPSGETLDLGALRLPADALLVSGLVMNPTADPQGGVRVRVTGPGNGSGAGGRGPGGQGGGGRGPGGDGGGRLETTTDAEGRFRVWARPVEGQQYVVVADRDADRSAETPFDPGDRNLSVVLRQSGGLSGKVRLADPRLEANISLQLRPSDPADTNVGTDVRLRPDGSFRATRLVPGRYDLHVRVNGLADTVVPALLVPDGEIATPSSLSDLVVGHDLFLAEVTVTDAAGTPVPRAAVSFRWNDQQAAPNAAPSDNGGRGGRRGGRGGRGGGNQEARTDAEGRTAVVLPRGDIQVSVQANGFARADVKNATFPLTVRLDRGAEVTVRLTSGLPTLPDIGQFRLILTPAVTTPTAVPDLTQMTIESLFASRGGGRGRNNSRTIDPANPVATFENTSPGTYQITLMATPDFRRLAEGRAPGGNGPGNPFRNLRPLNLPLGTVTVLANLPTQSFEMTIDPAAVQEAAQAAAQSFPNGR